MNNSKEDQVGEPTTTDIISKIIEKILKFFGIKIIEQIDQNISKQKVHSSKKINPPLLNKTDVPKMTQMEKQRKLILLLGDRNYFDIEDIHRFWIKYVDSVVNWPVLKVSHTQMELAGDLVAKATQKKNFDKLYKEIIPPKK